MIKTTSILDYLDYVRNSGRDKSENIRVPLEFHEDIEDAIEVNIKIFQDITKGAY